MFIRLHLCVSCLGLPEASHSFRSRHMLVLEQSVVVERYLRAGIT
jgi:hypothetical protein